MIHSGVYVCCKRVEVAVVDADDGGPGRQRQIKLPTGVYFHQRGQALPGGKREEFRKPQAEHTHNQQNGVRADGLRFVKLKRIDNEILA